jgi:putative integral membrane protein (TIGR02587 family)
MTRHQSERHKPAREFGIGLARAFGGAVFFALPLFMTMEMWQLGFYMAAGAIFFAFNIAPTEEMMLVAVNMSAWAVVAAGMLSLLLMHAFVYAVEFRGRHVPPEGTRALSLFLRFTVVGYAIALLMSAYVLWTFGRLDESSLAFQISTTIVLAFPASLGAAAARLVL